MRTRSPSLLLILLICSTACAANSQYSIDIPPSWVSPISLPADGGQHAVGGAGADYLLVDRQLRIDRGLAEYVRYVIRLLNQSGIDDESQISMTFDPAKDRVHLHHECAEQQSPRHLGPGRTRSDRRSAIPGGIGK